MNCNDNIRCFSLHPPSYFIITFPVDKCNEKHESASSSLTPPDPTSPVGVQKKKKLRIKGKKVAQQTVGHCRKWECNEALHLHLSLWRTRLCFGPS